jgi:hypothetical protein
MLVYNRHAVLNGRRCKYELKLRSLPPVRLVPSPSDTRVRLEYWPPWHGNRLLQYGLMPDWFCRFGADGVLVKGGPSF